MKRIYLPILLLLLLLISAGLFATPKAEASFIDDAINGIKKLIFGEEKGKPVVTVNSSISLAQGGDKNNNGSVDSGDIVTFTYIIVNPTDEEQSFGELKTGIDRSKINFIHNVHAVNLNDENGTITFSNLRIPPNQTTILSFDARILYSEKDIDITTEAEYMNESEKQTSKAKKSHIKAIKLNLTQIETVTNAKISK